MHDSFSVTFRHTSDHLIGETFYRLSWQRLTERVHVLLEILLQEIKDEPEAILGVDKILQWANVVMINFF